MMMPYVHRTSSVKSYDDVMCAQNIISGIIWWCHVYTEHHQWNHMRMSCVHKTSSVESYNAMCAQKHHQWNHMMMLCVHRISSVKSYGGHRPGCYSVFFAKCACNAQFINARYQICMCRRSRLWLVNIFSFGNTWVSLHITAAVKWIPMCELTIAL